MFYSCSAYAQESYSWLQIIEPQSKSELWVNPGMYSYHFQKDQNLNNNNWGIGLEYRFNTVASATFGNYRNSDNDRSSYLGIYYQPIAVGPVKLGVVAGGFNGYQSTNNGGWFPAVLPALTIEEGRFGANIFFIPTVGDRVHGAISLQLKFRIFDGS
ncbi:hypothetical protein ICN41_04490 [Polynucleobacter sp. 15G-AUS-farblos]|nr:hypothetical protein [Polynucleobacter sp. 15G-AUS-farblos]